MVLSPSGKYLAVAHVDNVIRFYHGDNHVKLGEYTPGFPINVIRFSNDGNYLAIGGVSTNIVVINGYEPFDLNRTFAHGLGSTIFGLDFSSDSTKFVACGATTVTPLQGFVWLYNVLPTGADWANATLAKLNPGGTATVINDCRISPFDGRIGVATPATLYLYSPLLAPLTAPTISVWTPATGTTNFSKISFNPNGISLTYIDRTGFELFEQYLAEAGPKPAMTVPRNNVTATANILWDLDISSDGKYTAAGG